MSAIHRGYMAAHRGPNGLVIDQATDADDASWWCDANPQDLNAKAQDSEALAVGATEDGTVVFFDPVTQPAIRQVLPKQPPTIGGKSTHIVLIDELATLLTPELGELTRQLMSQARKGAQP